MFEQVLVLPANIMLQGCKGAAQCPKGSVIRDWDAFP